jgi:FADH2 O2-dependent halogenase
MSTERHDVVIAGSGFAATILARALCRAGREVLVVERGRHPRFALGESSTPLAAITLERLAARYGLPDLADLGAWGRWRRRLPELGRGLKRGFTFWFHRPGEPWRPEPPGGPIEGPPNRDRLLIAASPNDEVADLHWLRADLDHHLVGRARAEGIEVREETALAAAEERSDGVVLRGESGGRALEIHAAFVVDATGPGGLLARAFGLAEAPVLTPATGLLFGHFRDVPPLVEAAAAAGSGDLEPGPYPDELAAVHHVIDGGWMYALRLDGAGGAPGRGMVSAGFVLDLAGPAAGDAALAATDPATAWRRLIERYPTLLAQYGAADPVRPIAWAPCLARRTARAAGRRWALLPHAYAFYDPLFSTGIAWSLAGIERLAALLGDGAPGTAPGTGPATGPANSALERYGAGLAAEADHVDRLVAGAWRAMPDPELFTAWSFLYFAAASFEETRQRLAGPGAFTAGATFLGAADPALTAAIAAARAALDRLDPARRPLTAADRRGFTALIAAAIAPRNVAGLAGPARRNLYPVDLEALVAAAGLLGLEPAEMRVALPRLLR